MARIKRNAGSESNQPEMDFTLATEIADWFRDKRWQPFSFQKECWATYHRGIDFVLHAPTGSGKTLAAWLGPVDGYLRRRRASMAPAANTPTGTVPKKRARNARPMGDPLEILWITPLRALSADTEQNIARWIDELRLPWTVERRTGDSAAHRKTAQKVRLPTVLVTTPESLSILLSYTQSSDLFQSLRSIVVDEWHELLGTKRGIQTELSLARLQRLAPMAHRCALSATLGNLDQALQCLQGAPIDGTPTDGTPVRAAGRIIRGMMDKKVELESMLPDCLDRFPWAGHLGMTMLSKVVERIESGGSTLLFTNTRNQTEQWYYELLKARPDWAGQIAIHHGSLDLAVRTWVENAMREQKLKAVVCTSSLDLGVDFTAVDQVIQIGSPKGAARLLQRAGRSGHQPHATSRLYFVPTNTLELVELAAAKKMIHELKDNPHKLECRVPVEKPLDCLVQHLVSCALAKPFTRDEIFAELRSTYSFRHLTLDELEWALRFVVHGGDSLRAYEDFHRVELNEGQYSVSNARVARNHRMAIGTIAGDVHVNVQFLSGKTLGTVEESFAAKLVEKDRFQFAGRTLEVVYVREGAIWVKKTKGQPNVVPRWNGGRMPLSSQLANEVRLQLDVARQDRWEGPELQAIQPTLELQRKWSALPAADEILVEFFPTKDSYCFCLYPFAGRMVHEGLAALLGYRWSLSTPVTLSMAVNDYGILWQSREPFRIDEEALRALFGGESLETDIHASMRSSELAKRKFREIARIAGLIHPGMPGSHKRPKHMQASSNMFYDAFAQYDPTNPLLYQARSEVLHESLEWARMQTALEELRHSPLRIEISDRPTPLAFPLLVEQMRQKLSSESLESRVRKLQMQLERAAQ